MKMYDKNIELLKNCTLEIPERYEGLDNIRYSETEVFEREGKLYYIYQGVERKLESDNFEKEFELYTSKIEKNKEHLIFVLGLGNTKMLEKLIQEKSGDSKIIIYEPNDQILKYVLDNIGLSPILVEKRVLLWWENHRNLQEREFAFDLIQMNWTKLACNIEIITCPAYEQYIGQFREIVNASIKKMGQYFMALGNSLEDVLQGFQQNAQNFVACMQTPDLMDLYNSYKGMPAIVVSAGPSLEKNIDILHKAKDKAVIIACDASWTACKMHGVTPDAIATLERGVETYDYYFKGKDFDKETVLIGPSLSWAQTYKEYPGKKIIVSKNDDGVDGWWNKQFDNLRFINTGMSCATLAYASAELMGCNPIILIGQDLAFTGNRKHSDFTHTEYEGENNAEEADGLMVEDIYGEMIPTDKYYNQFRFWFEDKAQMNPDIQLIDATEGGAKIAGSTIMTLEEAISKYCTRTKEKVLNEYVDEISISKEEVFKKKEEILKQTDALIHKLYKTKKKTEEHYATLEKVYDRINDNIPKNQLVNIVKKMQKGDQIINYMINQRDTITFFQQYITQTITYVKALGNELTAVNVLKNLYAQGNLMGAVKRACVVLIDECEKLKKTVEKEYDEYLEKMEE